MNSSQPASSLRLLRRDLGRTYAGRPMSPAPLNDLPDWATELVETARVGHLALIDGDGRPRVLPVTFAVAGGAAWSAVDHKPKRVEGAELARVRWLRRRPEATLGVDVYDDDWRRLAWVQVLGRVAVLDEPDPEASAALASKYRQYGEHPPAGPFLRLDPERCVHWRAAGD
jgi:PPOX class probable F420-dependent enzyme